MRLTNPRAVASVVRILAVAILGVGLAHAPSAATVAGGHAAAPTIPTAPLAAGAVSVPVVRVDTVVAIPASGLARLLRASAVWRSDVRKLVLRVGAHRLTFSADNPFVLLDDRTVRLAQSVRPRGGELQVPLDLLAQLPQDGDWPRLRHDPRTDRVWVVPAAGLVGAPSVTSRHEATVLAFACDQPERVEVVGRSRDHFRVRGEGALVGAIVDSVTTGAWISEFRATTEAGAVTFECRVDAAARGWRLDRDTVQRVVRVTFASEGDSLEPFAVSPARTLRTIVLDPGHGGDDAGVTVADAREKDLTLALAQRLALELQRRGVARVLLTRSDDHERTQEARAELANRAHADAVLALHFDEGAGRGAAAAVIWCAPAGATEHTATSGAVALRPWREAALDHAVASRALADRLAAALEAGSLGPARVRERLPYPLLGVQAPGVLLECGGLAVPETRTRLLAEHGLDTLAAALAEGVMAWARESR